MRGEGRPRRGRQAEAERNDWKVLEAARDVFAAGGPEAPVSAIARRAGVGMGTLYRRYGSKEALLQRLCLLSMEQTIAEAQAALQEEPDAWSALERFVRRCVGLRVGAFAPVAGTFPVTAEMLAASERGRELVQTLVERAQAEGTLRADVTGLDISWLIELFSRRRGASGPDGAPPEDRDKEHVRERLLALALDGLRATKAGPLPGPPPSWEHYRARWVR